MKYTIDIPEGLRDRMNELTAAQDRSLASYIVTLLKTHTRAQLDFAKRRQEAEAEVPAMRAKLIGDLTNAALVTDAYQRISHDNAEPEAVRIEATGLALHAAARATVTVEEYVFEFGSPVAAREVLFRVLRDATDDQRTEALAVCKSAIAAKLERDSQLMPILLEAGPFFDP